ncbi:ABC transporter permease [Quadrisphaera sp. GCM10027208]|uniref:ABC transporter permease n=1 Tax=Quadrisphaera sp. GCM10027208 TaxID=3273423 RepID=UPI00360685A3
MRSTRKLATDPEVQVYEPHKVGLPKIGPYVRDLWSRRQFAAELSRATMRAANSTTFFGQLWLVINPLLLAGVYYVLVNILSSRGGLDYLVHLVGGLFFFYFISGCVTSGAQSVTGSGKLVTTMAFPRLLMPLSAVRTAFFRFLPTMVVYLVIHVAAGAPWSPKMLLAGVFLLLATVFGAGLAALMAALQVYFRDTSSFLPYFVRLWLYLSPVLWYPEDVVNRLGAFSRVVELNPLYSIIGGWTDLLVRSEMPQPETWLAAAAWALIAAVAGFTFFMSRERDFAVRL